MRSSPRVERNGIFAVAAAIAVLSVAGCGGDKNTEPAQPAERHLVYVRATTPPSVWIADVDGANARKLDRGSTAVLSPDGRTVAIARGRQGIDLVSSDGKNRRRVTTSALQPQAWSPDGETLMATGGTSRAVTRLVAIDRRSGRQRVVASGSLYGFDYSPNGDELVYSRAPEATAEGICGDQFDLYVKKLAGGEPTRLTHNGVSAFPVWGSSGIAFSRFPQSGDLSDCAAPGVWTIDPDGSNERAVISRAPPSITLAGYYGFQPLAWLDEERVLVGLRTESGTEGAILDTKTKHLRRLGDFADHASSDGRYSIGSGGEQALILSELRLSDGKRVLLRKDACCPSWNR